MEQPVEPLTDEAIRAELWRHAVEGFASDGAIITRVIDALADETGDAPGLEARVRRLADEVFETRAAEERTWPVPTDCDRLDRAFAALERKGVVARQDFSCCQTCGHREIGEPIEATRGPVHGYAFFHQQDTEGAADGLGLYLAFGAVLPPGAGDDRWRSACEAVGREVAAALQAEGLTVQWDGTQGQRLHVLLDWRRRRRR